MGRGIPAHRRKALVGDRVVGTGNAPARVGPSRGDIHIVDFPEIGGHVIRGPHPGVIVQTDRMQRSSTVVVVPLTSAAKAASFAPRFLVQVESRGSGLPRDGWAKCDQPFTIPTAMLGPRAGRLNPETLDRVEDALRFVLGL
jgi:mRNA-degrading endonuclease toxin of MazEF toxin-antitoxin module